MILTYTQNKVLEELKDGGKVFLFEDGSVGLDNYRGDTLKFRKTTFNFLLINNLIEIDYKPSLGVEVYKISNDGKVIL